MVHGLALSQRRDDDGDKGGDEEEMDKAQKHSH
jgi:hypothetical protein